MEYVSYSTHNSGETFCMMRNCYIFGTIGHKILTTDNILIQVIRNRYPQIQNKEIDTQMQELLADRIVASSFSLYNSLS